MARERYPRQREYPHPPPPSTNNTRTTINMVIMSSPFYSILVQCRLETKAGLGNEPKAETRPVAASEQAEDDIEASARPAAILLRASCAGSSGKPIRPYAIT
jgi:hypothetical protein